jgi:hypothetical protein
LELLVELFAGGLVIGVTLRAEGAAGVVDPAEYFSRRRRRKLATPQAAEVFSPLVVRSGRAIIA